MVSIFFIIPVPFARVYAFPPVPPLFLSRGSPRTLPGAPPLDPVGGSAPLAVHKGRCASPPRRLWVSGGMRWPAAHRERRARFVCDKTGRKGVVDGSLGLAEIPAYRGGGGWARSALKERTRGLWPRPRSFVWRPRGGPGAAPRPPNAAAPRRDPGASTNVKKATQKPGLTAYPATSRPPLGEANFYADSIVFSGEFPYSRR